MSYEWILTVMIVASITAISPGPVNLLSMNAGVNKEYLAGFKYIAGATIGFCILLLISGFGLQSLIDKFPSVLVIIKWVGVLFIGWIGCLLWKSNGKLDKNNTFHPTFLKGALLQWLNPKAWLVSLSVVGLYAPEDIKLLFGMASIYFVICFLSIFCWFLLGLLLTRWLNSQKFLPFFNKLLAIVLFVSLIYLLL